MKIIFPFSLLTAAMWVSNWNSLHLLYIIYVETTNPQKHAQLHPNHRHLWAKWLRNYTQTNTGSFSCAHDQSKSVSAKVSTDFQNLAWVVTIQLLAGLEYKSLAQRLLEHVQTSSTEVASVYVLQLDRRLWWRVSSVREKYLQSLPC